MPGSTYSSNLKIELMTTGENSGTWGDVTNTNLGTALEQAIIGYGNPDYTSDANLTITITNSNASQAARCLVLNVTSVFGALTATRELIVPTSQKQYIVQNNTTGGQSITVKTSAGTGITVPNGRKAHLYVNGTDVIQMFDFVDINGGAIDGTPIGAASASTGAFTTLSATGNVTLSGGTANGVAYLNGSKVLTTGSALTFDGTNLGLGGTNNSYGSQTTMTLSGTNVSRIDFRSNSTFTGTILSYQAVTEGLRLQTEAGYPITFYPAGTKAATIDTAGNLGLGVTPSAWDSGWSAIQVSTQGASFVGRTGGNEAISLSNAYRNSASWKYITSTSASMYQCGNGIHTWFIAPSGTAGNAITFTQAMTLDASGNLGVGSTSPNIGGLTRALTLNTPTGGNYSGVELAGAGTLSARFITNNAAGTFIGSQLSIPLVFETNATERARIDSSGNVGIGTSSPATKLDLLTSTSGNIAKFSSSGSYGTVVANNGSTTGGGSFSVWKNGTQVGAFAVDGAIQGNTSSDVAIYAETGSSLKFYTNGSVISKAIIDSSGNLGLGVTPNAWLSLKGLQTVGGGSLTSNTNSTFIGANWYYDGANKYIANGFASRYILENGSHQWYSAPNNTSGAGAALTFTQGMTLDASGNLGIGTTSPSTGKFGDASCAVLVQSSSTSTGTNIFSSNSNNTKFVGFWSGHSGADSAVGVKSGTALTFGAWGAINGAGGFSEWGRFDSSGNLLVAKTSLSTTTVGVELRPGGRVVSTLASSTSGDSTYEVYSTGAGAYRFYVDMSGTIRATSITITAISDERLKENVRDIDTGLNSIMALKPRRFDWKEGKGQDKKNVAGFIAQEFETVFPECVSTSRAGADGIEYKNINHETLIPTLVKSIQEQQALITQLTARITALESA